MGDTVIDKLCAQLTGTVANKAADEFYNEFSLIRHAFSEYDFREMMGIFHLPGMECWPELLTPEGRKKMKPPTPMRLSMVCFEPPSRNTFSTRAEIASWKAREMLQSIFTTPADRESMDTAFDHFPTIAIFMAQVTDDGFIGLGQSILDVRDDSTLHCLAAVNYFRHETHTQVLFLGTTLDEPPVDSIHVIWQHLGLATYLLCMLVKQHTRNNNIQHSILSLQATRERDSTVCRFYEKLGFTRYDQEENNGLSLTSEGFRDQLAAFPNLWVNSQRQSMYFFQLCQGRLLLTQKKKLFTETVSDGSVYAKFPCPGRTMNVIEGYLENRPILTWLSGEPLSITPRPLITTTSKSKISGKVVKGRREALNDPREWLSTDDIQFLVAFLMRNQERKNRLCHVLCPTITQTIALVYESMLAIQAEKKTDQHYKTYQSNLKYIHDYIDTILDILHHKFLVFLCNVNKSHWLSVVVVNPLLVSDPYLNQNPSSDEDFCGWCVLNSMQPPSVRQEANGLEATMDTKNEASYGVRLFLNICASYLKAKKSTDEGDGRKPGLFDVIYEEPNVEGDGRKPRCFDVNYEEPFGPFVEWKGTASFPRFDYNCPSILQQSNNYDCGLAVVANSMAFVKHSKDLQFMKANMDLCTENFHDGSNEEQVRFVLNERIYSLETFWDNELLLQYRGQVSTAQGAQDLLTNLRREYIEIIDEISTDSSTRKQSSTRKKLLPKRKQSSTTKKLLPTNIARSSSTTRKNLTTKKPSIQEQEEETEKEVRRKKLQLDFVRIQEECEVVKSWSCDSCKISIPKDYPFMVPNLESDAMKFIGQTPDSLGKVPEFSNHFDAKGLGELTDGDWDKLCQWPSNYVETYVALMSHAFHCNNVQCVFIPEIQKEEENEGSTPCFTLGDKIKIVLAITYKDCHYALLNMNLETRKVEVYDSAGPDLCTIADRWREHVLQAIRMHMPNKLEGDGINVRMLDDGIPFPNNSASIHQWTVKCHIGIVDQKKDYSCGPIAMNLFANMLDGIKSLSRGKILEDDGIAKFIKLSYNDDDNVENAKCLFRFLLENSHDFFVTDSDLPQTQTEIKETAKAKTELPQTQTEIKETAKAKTELPQTQCHAGHSCRNQDIEVIRDGKLRNGSLCCKCEQAVHTDCSWVFSKENYCIDCYKTYVVPQFETLTLFCDLLQSKRKRRKRNLPPRHQPSESDLLQHVDNFLDAFGCEMNTKQFMEWETKLQKKISGSKRKRKWNIEDKLRFHHQQMQDLFQKKKYLTLMELAKEEWLLSTDGVVQGLRYNKKDDKFVARVVYDNKGGGKVKLNMAVGYEWVIDEYGTPIASKLVDRANNHEYIKPVNKAGVQTVVKIDDRKILRVKYVPATFYHETDDKGGKYVTNDVCAKAAWKGVLEGGKVVHLLEDVVTENFTPKFVHECKKLGKRKFVDIPVGSCKSSLMKLMPNLRCEDAPPVKYMQGEVDSCVFSSLASAFGSTAIPALVQLAHILYQKSKRSCEKPNVLVEAKEIVEKHCRWLQPNKLPRTFNWENDMNDYMFFLGRIKDSTGACQHAVTIFRNWIYDSNEPFALPLSQESLDFCTWDIKDGKIVAKSTFVCFSDGWIFQEQKEKKKKILG